MKFNEMGLPDFVARALTERKFDDATEIQEKAIPLIASGADVIGLSQTGSGKTYAYGIPALGMIDVNIPATQVLIICPTRELVSQVVDDMKRLLGNETRIRIAPIFGGSNIERQEAVLRRGAKIVVGTPGRLMDHLRRKSLRMDYLKMAVLDEADEMLNMGFKPDIETILRATKPERQTAMFSATMPPAIKKLTKEFMREAVTVKTEGQDCCNTLIKQFYVNCNKPNKVDTLEKIYKETNPFVSIVFCNTKSMTEDLSRELVQRKLLAFPLHGDMKQRDRTKTMERFKKDGGILVATDVAARGIDVKNVDIVVNFDFPNNEEYYTHRIGRTGRAGTMGKSFTIIHNQQQVDTLHAIVQKLGGEVSEYTGLSSASFKPCKNCKADFPTFREKKNQAQNKGRDSRPRQAARVSYDSRDADSKPRAASGASRPFERKPSRSKANDFRRGQKPFSGPRGGLMIEEHEPSAEKKFYNERGNKRNAPRDERSRERNAKFIKPSTQRDGENPESGRKPFAQRARGGKFQKGGAPAGGNRRNFNNGNRDNRGGRKTR